MEAPPRTMASEKAATQRGGVYGLSFGQGCKIVVGTQNCVVKYLSLLMEIHDTQSAQAKWVLLVEVPASVENL